MHPNASRMEILRDYTKERHSIRYEVGSDGNLSEQNILTIFANEIIARGNAMNPNYSLYYGKALKELMLDLGLIVSETRSAMGGS